MTKKQMLQWQSESIEQAYAALETETLIQYAGYVSYTAYENN